MKETGNFAKGERPRESSAGVKIESDPNCYIARISATISYDRNRAEWSNS